jgi:hypothetical protein
MRGSAFERRLSRVEAATTALRHSNEPSPERRAEIARHMDALTSNEKVEVLNLWEKYFAGRASEDDCARISVLWGRADAEQA